ncbi:hypothetical protein [Chondrinema litorale]|uniref:hypothetical protein n=1 Tax=Chondrinema litorale TaxID=2994555 RepID=UPI000C4AC4BA|nr:hypothetical protein [Chondrinema litorale]MBT33837.1 hypothetical protein [Thalassovita sp.]UZR96927.1 hypothetical protein OQ292_24835 [Chondrinema litorale]
MAEIKIERKKKSVWQWIVAFILILVVAVTLIITQLSEPDNSYENQYNSSTDTQQVDPITVN